MDVSFLKINFQILKVHFPYLFKSLFRLTGVDTVISMEVPVQYCVLYRKGPFSNIYRTKVIKLVYFTILFDTVNFRVAKKTQNESQVGSYRQMCFKAFVLLNKKTK